MDKREKIFGIFLLIFLIFMCIINSKYGNAHEKTNSDFTIEENNNSRIELARSMNSDLKEQIIEHTGYTVSYNSDLLIPNWVSWELTREEVNGQIKRPTREFKPDPNVEKSAVHKDYTKSGYARGHMFPAADARWNETVMNESFYLSNVCPQNQSLNAGVWLRLEDKCRQLAQYGNLYICSGPIMEPVYDKIGENEVAVPVGFFKVLCMKRNGKWQGIGFVFPNNACKGVNMFDQAVTIDEVESQYAHLDFFYNLPDSIETVIESSKDIKDWQ